MEENERGLREAVGRDRYDRLARQALADWLEEHDRPEEARAHRQWTAEWQVAADWLLEFCKLIQEDETPVPLGEVVRAGHDARDHSGYACVSGLGYGAEDLMRDETTRGLFWKHWAAYVRAEVDEETRGHEVFACSC